jgi:hypothetical protein
MKPKPTIRRANNVILAVVVTNAAAIEAPIFQPKIIMPNNNVPTSTINPI